MIHTVFFYFSAPDDYQPLVDEALMIPAGFTEECADLSIIDDDGVEPTETFLVSLSSLPGDTGVMIASPSQASISIIDNDLRELQNINFTIKILLNLEINT